MVVWIKKAGNRNAVSAFTLVEVLTAFFIFALVMMGVINGYVQANRTAEWSSQSLASMSYALQGMEQLKAAQWDAEEGTAQGAAGNIDNLGTNYQTNQVDYLDVPTTGQLISVTNYLTALQYTNSAGISIPPLKVLYSQVVWTFNLTGEVFSNVIVTMRAPDQLQ